MSNSFICSAQRCLKKVVVCTLFRLEDEVKVFFQNFDCDFDNAEDSNNKSMILRFKLRFSSSPFCNLEITEIVSNFNIKMQTSWHIQIIQVQGLF